MPDGSLSSEGERWWGRGDGNNWMGCNDGGEEGGRGGRLRMIDASIETRTCGEVG